MIVGGGHNGLVAATYLAQADLSVLVLERLDTTGGAAVSASAFPGHRARLSRYSYLVSVMPDQIVSDLGLDLDCAHARSRPTRRSTATAPTPACSSSATRARPPPSRSAGSPAPTASTTHGARSTARCASSPRRSRPTLLEPLRTAREVRDLVDPRPGTTSSSEPLGQRDRGALRRRHRARRRRHRRADRHLRRHERRVAGQNRCFLYHLIGNGTGEWRVPVGGMGAVTDALARGRRNAGATIVTGAGSAHRVRRRRGTVHLARRRRRRSAPATGCSPTSPRGCCRSCSARRPGSDPRARSSRSTCCSTGCPG